MKKIIVTGGTGRFGKILKKIIKNKYLFPNKNELNILSLSNIETYFKKKKPKVLIHLAGLSRPMDEHESNISKSIKLNIIGTCNIVMACKKFNVKLIYFSTSYVYPGTNGNYLETDPLLPVNNYAWSKLGGETAVQMYQNSLIIRACMTERPFIHKKALSDVRLNFIFQDEIAEILPKLIKLKGIINVGGPIRTVYDFAKKYNPSVKKISLKNIKNVIYKKNMSMNISKFKKIYKKKI
jgi:dTDP-4-dehydrorhamnose reductase|tara:strand:+ start:196 stop:909 length:714 start_codon:yes stop_codon:yes gene_type:complete